MRILYRTFVRLGKGGKYEVKLTILVLDTENKNVYTDSRSYSEWVYQPTNELCSITDDNMKKCWKVRDYCIAISGQSSYSYENFIDCFLKYG